MVPLYWYTNTFLFCLCLRLPRRLRPCLLVLHIGRCREVWGSSSPPVLGHFTAEVTIRSSWSGKEKRGPTVCPEGQEVGEGWGLSWLKCFFSPALQEQWGTPAFRAGSQEMLWAGYLDARGAHDALAWPRGGGWSPAAPGKAGQGEPPAPSSGCLWSH